jgi:hypothetical protein
MLTLMATIALATSPLAQGQAPEAPKEKKICRAVAVTGSIMAKRICLTRTEWAQFNAENERHADMMKESRNRAIDTRAMGELDE